MRFRCECFLHFFIVSIILISSRSLAQSTITPEMIRQMQKGMGSGQKVSQQDINKYLNSKAPADTNLSKDSRLFDKKADSVAAAKPAPEQFSPYEDMLQGRTIDPDSILPNLSVFGANVFSQSRPSTFAPTDNAAVPADYPLNVGDEIIVLLWGRINEEYRLKITREGTINIPRIGPISVAGLPFEAMQTNILSRVGNIEGVQASVSMGELRSIGIYIVGEVHSPGFYTVSSLSNVTNALFAAGGPTRRGSLRSIQLKRGGSTIATVDFYNFLLSGKDRSGLRLQSGDVILVPIAKSMAAVAGNVRRSALYELKGKTQLSELIDLAGGLTPAAWTNRIQVERFEKNDYQIVLDIDSPEKKIPSFQINDGDIIKVFPVLQKDKNAVYLRGNVIRPGKYEFKEGMRVQDILKDFDRLLPETYFEYAVILRQEPPSFLDRILAFNLKSALENPVSEDNVLLKAQDEIVVYNSDFFEPDRSIIIDGAVTTPGKQKLMENMRIRDLVLQAGGLTEEASPLRGELYRRTMTNDIVSVEKIDFCVECAMQNDLAHNQILQKSDRVFIRSKKGWENERRITLKGQFLYPGTYVLFEGETLGDLIERAGGFRSDAYLAAAIFTRTSVKALEEQRLSEYSRQLETDIIKMSAEMAAKSTTEEMEAILAQQMAMKDKLGSATALGRVVLDLRQIENYRNFVLEDGDELVLPRNANTVSVIGEVFNPATFQFNTGRSKASSYIEAAGGYKESSDKKHVYIVKANGSIITNKMVRITSAKLEPGDAVVVPQKIKYAAPHKVFVDTADAIFKIVTVLATVLTVMIAANQLKS